MASFRDLRPTDPSGVHSTTSPGRSLHAGALAAAALAIAAIAVGLLVLLAGSGSRAEAPLQPRFLSAALGDAQADAPLRRRPVRGMELRADGRALRVRREGADAALVSTHAADGDWHRFEHGATRQTPFGSETVVFLGEDGLEQFLNVESRVGRRTWRWRIDATGRPRLARDGSVSFVSARGATGLRIAPVQILDALRRDVTPGGLRWSLAHRGGAWWLELDLDDRRFPLPYVIDPAITQSGATTANTTASPLAITRPGAVGDLLLAQVAVRSTGAITAPAGWNLLSTRTQGTTQQAVYWRIATGSEGTSWSWTGGGHGAGGIVAYANPHPTSPVDVATSNVGSGGTATATGGTAVAPAEMVVALYGTVGSNPQTLTQSTGEGLAPAYTDQTGSQNPATRVAVLGADGVQAASGTISSKTATLATAGEWVAHLVSIRQAPDDGSGSMTSGTANVAASSTGNTIAFTYSAGPQGMAAGAVALAVPPGWTAPSTTGSGGGHTTASTGSVSVAGQTVTVSGVTLAPGATLTITYGSKASGGPGATASSTGGAVTWQAQQRGTAGGTLTAISSPSVNQYAPNGSGTIDVAPTTVDVGTSATATFTYTAAAGGMSDGAVTVAVPTGWPAPTTAAGTPGSTTASAGTVSTAGQTITVSNVTLAGGATLTITYGSGAGGAVTVPSGVGSQTWQARQRSVSGGTLTSLAASPSTTFNNAPTATVSLAPSPPTTNQTLTATATRSDADGDAVTLTYVWKVNGVTRKTTSGSASLTDTFDLSLAGNGDKGQTVSVEATPNDGSASGATATDSTTVVNAAPTIASAAIDQASPRTNDTLTVTVASADADGDPRTYAYQWRKNGVDLDGQTGATLDLSAAGNGSKGDEISVRVTASDGTAGSTPLTSSAVTIQNTAPVIDSVAVDQASPSTGQTLSLTVSSHDDDGDAVTYAYQWQKNGADLGGATAATLDLSIAGNGDRGDALRARVTGSDGTASGSPLTSAAVTVVNSAPAATVSLGPSSPTTDQTLTATATRSDADGDTVTLTYVWKVNGVTRKTTSGSASLTDTFDLSLAGNGDKGQTVSVEATPNDGSASGATATDSTTVVNAAPTIASAAIDQASPRTNDTLTVTVASADADGDPRTYAYQWRKNGVDLDGQTGATLDLAVVGDKDDEISVRVTADDGTAGSTPATSAAVTIQNSAPVVDTVAIDQAAPRTDDTLTVTVVASDPDGDVTTTAYQWAKNGVDRFGETAATYDLAVFENGQKGDAITVRAIVDDGTSSAAVTSGIRTVANSAPTLSAVSIDQAAPETHDTLTATITAADPDGDAITPSRQWRKNGVDLPGETAAALDLSIAGNGDKGDGIAVRVSVSDGTDTAGPLTSAAVTVVNAAPTVSSASIDQAAPATDATLTVTVVSADADADPRAHAYQWRRNGVDLPGETGPTLDLSLPGNGGKGDAISVRVTANDGTVDSAPVTSAAVTVANTLPTATVSLAPASPATGQTLTATATRADLDGDAVTLTYVWKVDGTTVQTTAASTSLTDVLDLAVHVDRGEVVSVEVTPNDGESDGPAATASETVANSAPSATVSLSPASPTTAQTLTATATTADPDGDPVTLTYVWKVDGTTVQTTAASASLTDTLDLAVHADKGQMVSVEATPNDGAEEGAAATDQVTVANSAPGIASVAIDQAAPRTDDVLTAAVSSSDPDGDARTHAYQWLVNGVDVPGETGATLDLAVVGDKGDQVAVRVTADDGDAASAPVTSAAVTVANTAPVLDAVAIDQAAPRTDDTLTVTVASSDADGDARTYAYQWRLDGVDLAGQTGATLDLAVVGDKGDAIGVRVTAGDGDDDSAPLTSAAVTVANSAPVVVSATIDQATPRTNDALTVSVVGSDADGDPLAYAYQWARNGVDRFGETGAGYDLSLLGGGDKGDAITVRVTADDGDEAGSPVTSGARTVANSAPTLAVAIAEATATTDDTLTADVTAGDADGDPVTLAYQWRRGGTPLAGETGASLDLSQPGNGDRGDAIVLEASADDGGDAVGPLASAPLTIANSPPTITSVTIAPAAPTTDATLTATAVADDADGDAVTLAYRWTKDGADLAGATGPTLDLSVPGNGDRGDELAVRVTAGDGTDMSAPSTSAGETVANSAPVCAPTTLDTTQDTPADAAPVCTDADGDAVTPQIAAQGTKGVASVTAGDELRYAPDAGAKGADAFTYRGSDGVDASAPATVTVTIDDVTAPQTTIDAAPADPSGEDAPSVSFSADEPGSTFECRLDGAWSPCTSPLALGPLADGPHTLEVRATDDHGNTDPTPAAHAWTVDTTAPATTIEAGPADPSGEDAPSVSFSADEPGSTFECRLDGGAWSPCTSPLALGPLADGPHTLDVRAVDGVGNAGAAATHAWTVDTLAPGVTLEDPGSPLAGAVGLAATAAGDAVSVRFERSPADGDTWAAIGTDADGGDGWGVTWATGGDGLYDLRAVATDAAGNEGVSAVVEDRLVDTGAPTVTITAPTAAGWVAGDPFTVTATTPDLDVASVAFSACSNAGCAGGTQTPLGTDADGGDGWSVSASVPADGRWTIRAIATDGAANTGEDVVDAQVDRTAPSGGSVAYPDGFDADGSVAIATADGTDTGSGVDPGSAVLERDEAPRALGACGVFDGTWTAVTSPDAGLADGWCYVYRYRVADAAGNQAVYTSASVVVVDTTPPTTTDDAPAAWSGGDVTVALTATDAVAGVAATEYRVDGGPWTPYAGPFTVAGHGTHALEYRSTDGAGNEEALRTATVRIDLQPPTTLDDAPAGWQNAAVTVTLAADDDGDSGVALTEHRVDGGPWTPGASIAVADDGAHALDYRSTDAAGNVEPTRSVVVRVDATAPSVAITVPNGGDLVGGTVAITSAQADVHSGIDTVAYAYSVAGADDWEPTSSAWDTTALADGAYDLRATATDLAGNVTVSAVVAGVQVDNHPPTLSFDAPADGAYVNASAPDPLALAATTADGGTGVRDVEFLECNTAGPTCSTFSSIDVDTTGSPFAADWTLPADGERVLKAVATDNVGHAVEELVTVTVDRTAPSAPLALPGAYDGGSALYVAGTAALVSGAADATSGVDSVVFQQLPGTDVETDTSAPYAASWSTGALADGPYDLRAFVTDRAGNATAGAPVTVHVDNTAPTTTDDAPAGWRDAPTTVSFAAADASGSGVAETEYRVGGGPWQSGASVVVPAPADHANDGVHTIEYRSTDNVGNEEAPRSTTVRIDTAAPLTTDDAAADWVATDVTVALTADDGAGGSGLARTEYRVDGGAWQTGTSVALAPAGGTEHAYLVEYRSTDAAGNVEPTRSATVRIDKAAPATSDDAPGGWQRIPVAVTLSAGDGGSGVTQTEHRVDGGAWTAGASVSVPTTSGDHVVEYRSTDAVGNVEATRSVTVRMDTTAPVTTDDAPAAPSSVPVAVALAPTDAHAGVASTAYRVDGGAWQSGTSVAIPAPADTSRQHVIEYASTDAVGNVEATRTTVVTIDTRGPSGGPLDPGSFLSGSVMLAAEPTDDSGIASVQFEYSPAGMDAWAPINTPILGPPFETLWVTSAGSPADGDYDLRVAVVDGAGNTTYELLPGVPKTVDNTPATGSVVGPPGPFVSGTVTVAATASDTPTPGAVASVAFELKDADDAGFRPLGSDTTAPYAVDWDTTAAPDGPAQLRVIVRDVAGNAPATSAVHAVTVDNDAPTVELADPGAAAAGTVALAATGAADVVSVRFERRAPGDPGWVAISTDSTAGDGFAASFDTTGLDGPVDLRAVAVDGSGNEGTSPTRTLLADNTAPTGAVTRPAAGSVVGGPSVTLETSAADAGSGVASVAFEYRAAGDPGFTSIPGTSWDASGLPSGAYELRAVVADAVGNVHTTAAVAVTVDSTAPTVSIDSPGASLTSRAIVSAAVSGGGAVSVAFALAPAGTAAWTTVGTATAHPWRVEFETGAFPDGVYDLRAVVTDGLGNVNADVFADVLLDNTKPRVVSSTPADGSTVAAAASVDVVASEALAAVAGATLDGAPVAIVPSGAGFSLPTGGLADGPHTLAGELRDPAGRARAFRVHFTVLSGGVPADVPYVEKNTRPDTATTLAAADGSASATMPAGAYAAPADGDWLVLRVDPVPAASITGSATLLGSAIVDVTARWALGGTEQHAFDVPIDIVLAGTGGAGVLPATYEGGAWRTLEPVAQAGVLPAEREDGFYVDGAGTHVLTRHLSLFALLLDAEAPAAPSDLAGVVAADGLTLRWVPGRDNSGLEPQVVELWVDGAPHASFGPRQFEAKLGEVGLDDGRRFRFRQRDAAGNWSAFSPTIVAIGPVEGMTLAQASAEMARRGLAVGAVREKPSDAPAGTVVGFRARVPGDRYFEPGRAVDLVVSGGPDRTVGEARLVLGVVATKAFSWRTGTSVGVRLAASRASRVQASLMSPRGGRLYTWRFDVRAGATVKRLRMPAMVRRAGRYRLVVTAASDGQVVRRTVPLRILPATRARSGAGTPRRPIDVVLAGGSVARTELARVLGVAPRRVVAGDGESAFELTGSASRNVRAVVVAVDELGLRLVRELRIVFPDVKLVATARSAKVRRRALAVGADAALPATAAPARVARTVRGLTR